MFTRRVVWVLLFAAAGCKCSESKAPDASSPPDAAVLHAAAPADAAVQVAAPAAAPASGTEVDEGSDAGLAEGLAAPIAPAAFAASVAAVDESAEVKDQPVKGSAKDDPAAKYFRQLYVNKKLEAALVRDGFAVDGNDQWPEFFGLYEVNRYRPLLIETHQAADPEQDMVIHRKFLTAIPSVVTPDLVLENLHLFFDYALATAEQEQFRPILEQLANELLRESKRQGRLLAGTPWAEAAEDDQAFFATTLMLLHCDADPEVAVPGVDTEEVDQAALEKDALQELDGYGLSEAAGKKAKADFTAALHATGAAKPAVFAYPDPLKEDFTQYKARGHYVKTAKLRSYFRAMMWLSRVMAPVGSPSAVRSTALISLAMGHGDRLKRWQKLFDSITFLVGKPDDLTFYELYGVAKDTFSAPGAFEDPKALEAFTEKLKAMRPPEVQGVLTQQDLGPKLDDTKGFHFFSQRTVIDAVILQSLVNPKVPDKVTIDALEVPEVLGSSVAAQVLAPQKLAGLSGYKEAHDALVPEMAKRIEESKNRELYAGWLDALAPLLKAPPDGYPAFMRSEPYQYLRLDEYMASYAQLKHDTLLYTKQSYAEMGGPGFEDTEVTIDDRGYVIPEVQLYARVLGVMVRLREGLSSRGLFPADETTAKSWARFEELLGRLIAISKAELAGKPLSDADYELIRFIGGDLEHFWQATLIAKPENPQYDQLLDDNNNRLIADVFTGPGGVVHVATGYVHSLYLAFPRDGKLAIGRGGVMAFYQLTEPERLTDHEWRERLAKKPRPPLPDWVKRVILYDPKVEPKQHYFEDQE